MKTSGIIKVALRGLKNYLTKLKRSCLEAGNPGYQPMYMGTSWRKNLRKKEKLLSKNNWYKGKARSCDGLETGIGHGGRKGKDMKTGNRKDTICSTVVFVPNTRGGLLVRKLREREAIMKDLTGFGIKFMEDGGTQLKNSSSLDLGKGKHCGQDCPPCTTNGEKRGSRLCNPEDARRKSTPSQRDGIYYRESSRSLQERSKKHMRDASSFSKKSHIIKHWMLDHPEEMTPPPFARLQIAEALRIKYTSDIQV
jgi:hypothetical protein